MTSNQINYQNHLEGVRHNLAMEAETKRANLAGEAIGRSNAAASNTGAYAQLWQAQNTQYYNTEVAANNQRNWKVNLANFGARLAGIVIPLLLTKNVGTRNRVSNSGRYLM